LLVEGIITLTLVRIFAFFFRLLGTFWLLGIWLFNRSSSLTAAGDLRSDQTKKCQYDGYDPALHECVHFILLFEPFSDPFFARSAFLMETAPILPQNPAR